MPVTIPRALATTARARPRLEDCLLRECYARFYFQNANADRGRPRKLKMKHVNVIGLSGDKRQRLSDGANSAPLGHVRPQGSAISLQ